MADLAFILRPFCLWADLTVDDLTGNRINDQGSSNEVDLTFIKATKTNENCNAHDMFLDRT